MLKKHSRILCGVCSMMLFITGCTGTWQLDDDQVLISRAELEVLQLSRQIEESRGLIDNYQQQFAQTLSALQHSMDLQRRLVESQMQQQAQFNRLLRQQSEPESTAVNTDSAPSQPNRDLNEKLIVGEIEDIYLPEIDMLIRGRVDTGATTSSIDARNIQEFERNGERWVRFTIVNPETGDARELERRRVRLVRIIQSNEDEGERRPVVALRMTVGGLTQISDFTLTDRSHLEFPLLIGRNVLRDVMVVDVSRQNMVPVLTQNIPQGGSEEVDEIDEPEESEEAVNGGSARSSQ